VAAAQGRLGRERGVLVALALSGPLYVAVFPGRSVNHYFFVGLSAPFIAIAAALVLARLVRITKPESGAGPVRQVLAIGALSVAGLAATLVAHSRDVDVELSWDDPRTWLVIPLVIARLAPPAAVVLSILLARRRRGSPGVLCAVALTGALAGTTGLAVWDDIRFWVLRGDDRIGRLVAEPWMREMLDDPYGMVATSGTVSMPLQFYARGPVFVGVISNAALDDLSEDVFERMADEYRVVFLYDAATHARDAERGILAPAVVADLVALRERLLEIGEPRTWGGLEVYELTGWAHARTR
jgi:hypothetical protein